MNGPSERRRFWHQRTVFVTGASGLLGSWLVEELVDLGATVTCLMRDWVPTSRLVTSGLITRVNIVRGDLDDFPLVLRALNECEIDSVFHLGAQTIVGTASRSALSTFEANIRGTWNVPLRAPIRQVVTRRLQQAYPIYRRGYERHFEELDSWLGGVNRLLSFGRQGLFAHDNTHHALYMAYAAADCLTAEGCFDQARWQASRRVFETHVVED